MKIKKILLIIISIFILCLTSCGVKIETLEIVNGEICTLEVGKTIDLDYEFSGSSSLAFNWSVEGTSITIDNEGIVYALEEGQSKAIITIGPYSDEIIIIVNKKIGEDPYLNVNKEDFYANYEIASSYMDSYYRSLHGLMSGSIEEQSQEPTISPYQPSVDGVLIRNNQSYYSEDQNTYTIVDSYGEKVMDIYKGGAYITLEEVAAYVLAFKDIPANYVSNKQAKPTESIWKEYLRVNHTQFTGNTSKYPYEPVLPNISGCGGNYMYFEIDLGTTGTDCDPSYVPKIYNNGSVITRGAARIVYSSCDTNRNKIIDINERYLFYTYNHYNDFQEYLNYYGGWGQIFGNITGGGILSSKSNYNPTPYPSTILRTLN